MLISWHREQQSIAEEFSSVLENRGVNETDILDQIINQIKFTSDDAVKSMEIQLTPETLGKVNVLVSVREGVVTAQLNVQNEQVKKALEIFNKSRENSNLHDDVLVFYKGDPKNIKEDFGELHISDELPQ